MQKILNNKWFFNITKIIGILLCIILLQFHNIWTNFYIILFAVFVLISHNPYTIKALSGPGNTKKNWINYIAQSPGFIAFFTTLLNLFKVNQDIIGDFKQAIIMGILIHLATMTANKNDNVK